MEHVTRWHDLEPETGILAALRYAGDRESLSDQQGKRKWSEKFANACAVAVADAARANSELRKKIIKPDDLASGTEPLTPIGGKSKKRIDVTVVDQVLGLELGFSLKGFNWPDPDKGASRGKYDHNITGRLYELADETRLVHEHLPHAFMVAILFLPIDGSIDKSDKSISSFAHMVMKLRDRTGRLDPALQGHAARVDAGYVCLYALGNETQGFQHGIARFFNVECAPPRRGRPLLTQTLSLTEMIADVLNRAKDESAEVDWSEAEKDA